MNARISEVYEALKGALPSVPIPSAVSKWDIVTKNFILEIDEDAHFNRYRLITLDSPLYEQLPHFPMPLYKDLCVARESHCRKHKGYWQNDSTNMQFGISDAPGVFGLNGSSRWKQRAFYDFLKDASTLMTGFPVIRISIWEHLKLSTKTITVGGALMARSPEIDTAIRSLVDQRASKFVPQPRL